MNCQGTEDLLIQYLYGELDSEQTQSVRRHLQECPKCAARVAEMMSLREMVAGRKDPEPSGLVVQRILARAREEAEAPRRLWSFGWLKVAVPLCFMVVVGGWVALHVMERPSTKEQIASLKGMYESPVPADMDAGRSQEELPASEPEPERTLREAAPAKPAVPKEPAEKKVRRAEVAKEQPRIVLQKGPSTLERRERTHAAVKDKAAGKRDVLTGAVKQLEAGSEKSGISTDERTARAPAAGRERDGFFALEDLPDEEAAEEEGAPELMQYARPAETRFSVDSMLDAGDRDLEAGRYAQAAEAFSSVLDRLPSGEPARPRALLGLARAKEGLGHLAEARILYRKLADESPEHRALAERKMIELRSTEGQ